MAGLCEGGNEPSGSLKAIYQTGIETTPERNSGSAGKRLSRLSYVGGCYCLKRAPDYSQDVSTGSTLGKVITISPALPSSELKTQRNYMEENVQPVHKAVYDILYGKRAQRQRLSIPVNGVRHSRTLQPFLSVSAFSLFPAFKDTLQQIAAFCCL
ncbi:hypothetical protein ANN_19527 [Periplaneta americana]|uniref:Uncharacterized protein n=1 Tax=Periplaneta americana TaxID=6978 RepID=A0ABQ8SA50_PERAM|nr:hypothetical protein ANN_19527 [Periplaneta americana]